jgi:hypothetical protein
VDSLILRDLWCPHSYQHILILIISLKLFNKQHTSPTGVGVDVTVSSVNHGFPIGLPTVGPVSQIWGPFKSTRKQQRPMVFALPACSECRAIRLTVGSCASGILKSIKIIFGKAVDLLQISAWPVGLAAPVVAEH